MATLLIVEDEGDFVGGLNLRYTRQGYEVLSALTYEEAVKVIKFPGNDIAAALIDLWMPLQNGEPIDEEAGLKLIETMRGTGATPGIAPTMPVIIVTGHSSIEAAREGIRLGAQAYVIKNSEKWLAKLDKHIDYAVLRGKLAISSLVDADTLQLRNVDGEPAARQGLSDAEMDLLAEMLRDLRRQLGM